MEKFPVRIEQNNEIVTSLPDSIIITGLRNFSCNSTGYNPLKIRMTLTYRNSVTLI